MPPGRYAKPIQLHLVGGNKRHLTEAEIHARQEGEIHFGTKDFKPTALVKDNPQALKKWKEIVKLYTESGIDFVTTSDAGMLERYCLTYAEYYTLQAVRKEINDKKWDKVKTYHALDNLGLERDVNKKLDALTRMEDRLFLNPLAKIRNVNLQTAKKEKESALSQAGFGNV